MAYVDLNPVRANIATTPEQSDYTSVKERIRQHLGKPHGAEQLLPMEGDKANSQGLPFYLNDYLELVDWTGRAIRSDKSGSIPAHLEPVLQRLQLQPATWMAQQSHFGKRYFLVAGSREKIKTLALKIADKWMNGQGSSSPFVALS